MGIQVTLMTVAVAAAVAGAAPPTSPQPQYPAPAPSTPAAARYQFEYSVLDRAARLEFGQQERRDAAETSGSYRVLLPDGRHQRVRYSVLGPDGFLADVTYEGETRPYQPASRHVTQAGRPRTYTLQSASEAPLPAAAPAIPVATGTEHVVTVAAIEQAETAAEGLIGVQQAEATGGSYGTEEEIADGEQAAQADSRGYGTKLQGVEQTEKPAEPGTKPAYQPRFQPRYYPQYYPRHYPRYYPQYYPRHYPRYYPRYRPAGRARTYYTQQVVPEAASPPTTPATPVLETVGDGETVGAAAAARPEQPYGARTAGAGPTVEAGSEESREGYQSEVNEEPVTEEGSYESGVAVESAAEDGSYQSGVTAESVTETGGYESGGVTVESAAEAENYRSGVVIESVTEAETTAVYGAKISQPELHDAPQTLETPEPAAAYGSRTIVAGQGEEHQQEPARQTEGPPVTVGPSYRRDTE